jgi:hypothetical protein
MRSIGVIIMSFFAAIWWALGINASGHASALTISAGCLVSLAMVFFAIRAERGSGSHATGDQRRIGRIVMWASTAEGIAILAAVNVLNWAGLPYYIVCAVAVIVGLHFVPLARLLPNARIYNLTAIALVAVGLAGCLMPVTTRGLLVGTGAALVIWATCIGVIATLRPMRSPMLLHSA